MLLLADYELLRKYEIVFQRKVFALFSTVEGGWDECHFHNYLLDFELGNTMQIRFFCRGEYRKVQ